MAAKGLDRLTNYIIGSLVSHVKAAVPAGDCRRRHEDHNRRKREKGRLDQQRTVKTLIIKGSSQMQ